MQPTGTCYREAYDYLHSHDQDKELRLVHGYLGKEDCTHAWVENVYTGFVFDFANGNHICIERALYYEAHSIARTVCYDCDEALLLNVQSGHYGPWEDLLERECKP
jgi:hypothetical protein